MFSHHSHSGQFCSHAKGTLEEVVKEAIRRGWSTLGLSEHVPRYREQDLYPEEEELGVDHLSTTFEVYLVEAWRLKELYASRIAVLVGIESEYITDSGLDQLELLLKKHGDTIQYVVGSVHHCHEHAIDFDKHRFDVALASFPSAESSNTKKEDDPDANQFSQLFCAYFDAQYTVLDRLRPAVVGHFDLCRLYYPERDFRSFPAVWAKIERNIRLGVSYGALFEVNASAFRKGWSSAYPAPDVFEAIAKLGGRFTLSDDSHGPLAVGLHYDQAFEYLRQQGIVELYYLAEPLAGSASRKLVQKVVEGRPWLDEWPEQLKELDALV